MPVRFSCPNCRKKLKVADGGLGKHARCARCGLRLLVPEQGEGSYPMALPAPQAAVGAAESHERAAPSDSGRSDLTPVFGLVGAALIVLVLALAIAGSRRQAPDMAQAGASAGDRSSGTILPSMRPPEPTTEPRASASTEPESRPDSVPAAPGAAEPSADVRPAAPPPDDGLFDRDNATPGLVPGSSHKTSTPASGDKSVHVKEYTRKDGTHVKAHDRAAPGQGSSRPRGGRR
jgi:hypothetical protein